MSRAAAVSLDHLETFAKCREMIKNGHHAQLAAFFDREEVRKWIRLGGLDREGLRCEKTNVAQKTLLHIACEKGQAQCVQILLEAKASPNVKARGFPTAPSGETPLHLAAAFNHVECVQLLLDSKVLAVRKQFVSSTGASLIIYFCRQD